RRDDPPARRLGHGVCRDLAVTEGPVRKIVERALATDRFVDAGSDDIRLRIRTVARDRAVQSPVRGGHETADDIELALAEEGQRSRVLDRRRADRTVARPAVIGTPELAWTGHRPSSGNRSCGGRCDPGGRAAGHTTGRATYRRGRSRLPDRRSRGPWPAPSRPGSGRGRR